jgi:hypothetical protein
LAALPLRQHVPSDGNSQAKCLNSKANQYEYQLLFRVSEQYKRSQGQKKSGGHNE